jgi:hypothetical protein
MVLRAMREASEKETAKFPTSQRGEIDDLIVQIQENLHFFHLRLLADCVERMAPVRLVLIILCVVCVWWWAGERGTMDIKYEEFKTC